MGNRGGYKFWGVMSFFTLAYLIFAIVPPTVLFGVYVGSVCLILSLVFVWMAKERIKRETKPRERLMGEGVRRLLHW